MESNKRLTLCCIFFFLTLWAEGQNSPRQCPQKILGIYIFVRSPWIDPLKVALVLRAILSCAALQNSLWTIQTQIHLYLTMSQCRPSLVPRPSLLPRNNSARKEGEPRDEAMQTMGWTHGDDGVIMQRRFYPLSYTVTSHVSA